MQSIIEFFDGLENRPGQRLAFLVGGMLVLWIIEGAIPLITMRYKKTKLRHAAVNMVFTVMHLIIHTFLAILIVKLADWTKTNQFGLTHWLNANVLLTLTLSCLTLDFFGGWLVHIVEHKVPLFWRMHIIHHADNNVDVTTGLRHHPLESVFRGMFFMMGIFIGGIPMYGVMFYQTILILFTAFTHANISLPASLDRALSYILVSPNMHKVHHHWKQPYTDSNYGAVFSIWDRLLGTFQKLDPKDIRYGLDRYYDNEKDEDFRRFDEASLSKIERLMRTIAVIPARYAATRFPAKLMHMLGSKTVIRHTYDNTVATGLFDEVLVATDSALIADEIRAGGGKVFMSGREHESGSDRIAEAVQDLDVDVIVNVQGDEPFMQGEPLAKLVAAFEDPRVQVASLMHRIHEEDQLNNPNIVKLVTDKEGFALLFSRSCIPYQRNTEVAVNYYRHIGVYAYRKSALMQFVQWPMSRLENIEKLEQLRYLENGVRVKMIETDFVGIGIDTPEDLAKAREMVKGGG